MSYYSIGNSNAIGGGSLAKTEKLPSLKLRCLDLCARYTKPVTFVKDPIRQKSPHRHNSTVEEVGCRAARGLAQLGLVACELASMKRDMPMMRIILTMGYRFAKDAAVCLAVLFEARNAAKLVQLCVSEIVLIAAIIHQHSCDCMHW